MKDMTETVKREIMDLKYISSFSFKLATLINVALKTHSELYIFVTYQRRYPLLIFCIVTVACNDMHSYLNKLYVSFISIFVVIHLSERYEHINANERTQLSMHKGKLYFVWLV